MSSNTSMYACPKCGNPNTHVERRPDGFCYCPDCLHRWKIGESQPKPTLFDRITESPEVLAEKLVYLIVCEEDTRMRGWTSNVVQSVFETKAEAIAATVARLREAAE